jgi:tetratricopeptide (TPR) repeat protein
MNPTIVALLAAPVLGARGEEVVEAIGRAVAGCPSPEERDALRVRWAEHLLWRGELEAARGCLEAADGVAVEPWQTRRRLLLGRVELRLGLVASASERALDPAVVQGEPEAVWAWLLAGELALARRSFEQAGAALDEAQARCVQPEQAHDRWVAWVALATVRQVEGRLEEAAALLRQAGELADAYGAGAQAAWPELSLGLIASTGRPDEAIVALRRAVSRPELSRHVRPVALAVLGRLELGQGNPHEARECGLLAAGAAVEAENAAAFGDAALLIVQAERAAGRPEAAAMTFAAAVKVLRQFGREDVAGVLERAVEER